MPLNITIMGFPYRGETKELNDEARQEIGGSFIRLSDGYTHYELGGPADGKFIVLVHGFSISYFIWDPTFAALTSAGFRVLRYDLFGRGFSDRPRTKYNLDLFVRQLHELLNELKVSQAFVIGLSMGGAISSGFTVKYPERVLKLILIDPIGTQPMPLSWIYKAAILPGISELILGLVGTEKMVKSVASDFFDPAHVEKFQNQYRPPMQYHGYKRAILSTLRNKTVDGFPEVYKKLGKLTMPVLLFWGRQDQTLPFEQSKSILELVPRTEFHVIENTGHIPHYEKPEIVNPILINFLSK